MTQAYPIQWPTGRPRTKNRKDSSFRVHPTKAFDELLSELNRFSAKGVVVSSNIPTRRDGTPYRDGLTELHDDPGLAVYFTKGKRLICLPCDTYRRPWENARAIGKAVEAMRSMERHGAHQILDQAFEGFTALPSPDMVDEAAKQSIWVTLGIEQTSDAAKISAAYKARARKDGGATVELNRVKELAMQGAKG